MFCPQCGAEYRPGFTRCSDCDVDLVATPPDAADSEAEVSDGDMEEVWKGEDQNEFVFACERLKAAAVPFRVLQQPREYARRAEGPFTINVPTKFATQAKSIVGASEADSFDESNSEDESASESEMELPAEDDASDEEVGDSYKGSREDWYPEDATVEIFSEASSQYAWMIEMSLKENDIRSRKETEGDGSRIFVAPEDESRAREIIREITEAQPPK